MGEIIDIYNLIRDLIDEAHKQKNAELVDKLIDIKKMVSDLEDENRELKKSLELNGDIERHSDGTYITLKDDPLKIRYCAVCWGRDRKLIQMEEADYCMECWIRRESGKL